MTLDPDTLARLADYIRTIRDWDTLRNRDIPAQDNIPGWHYNPDSDTYTSVYDVARCSCGNVLTIVDYGGVCRQCRLTGGWT